MKIQKINNQTNQNKNNVNKTKAVSFKASPNIKRFVISKKPSFSQRLSAFLRPLLEKERIIEKGDYSLERPRWFNLFGWLTPHNLTLKHGDFTLKKGATLKGKCDVPNGVAVIHGNIGFDGDLSVGSSAIISPNSIVYGTVKSKETMVIGGLLQETGNVKAPNVTIQKGANVIGTVDAERITIAGRVAPEGQIFTTTSAKITPEGVLAGTLDTRRAEISGEVAVTGRVNATSVKISPEANVKGNVKCNYREEG